MTKTLTIVYSTCYEEFTSGQEDRIHSYWEQYRKYATDGETEEVTPAPL